MQGANVFALLLRAQQILRLAAENPVSCLKCTNTPQCAIPFLQHAIFAKRETLRCKSGRPTITGSKTPRPFPIQFWLVPVCAGFRAEEGKLPMDYDFWAFGAPMSWFQTCYSTGCHILIHTLDKCAQTLTHTHIYIIIYIYITNHTRTKTVIETSYIDIGSV